MTAAAPKSLRELRLRSLLSVQDVCRRAGVAERSLRRWEAGKDPIELRKLRSLAVALGISQDEIQLEPYRRHHANRGYRFVLCSNGRDASGYLAEIGLIDNGEATAWPHRSFDPGYPLGDSPMALYFSLRGTGATSDEALTNLADQVDAAVTRALHPDRLPGDPADWTPRVKPTWFSG